MKNEEITLVEKEKVISEDAELVKTFSECFWKAVKDLKVTESEDAKLVKTFSECFWKAVKDFKITELPHVSLMETL